MMLASRIELDDAIMVTVNVMGAGLIVSMVHGASILLKLTLTLLPIAYCLTNVIAYCLLPIAYYLLPIAYCRTIRCIS